MIRFYAPDIETTGTLPEVESGHCIRVLRMHEGSVIYVVNGKGTEFECVIVDASPKATKVNIVGRREENRSWQPRIVLAVAPTKNMDRMEWLVEKAVEIGVDKIVLLQCEHSERKVVKIERLEKIAVSAMKQSLKAIMPEIEEMTPFKNFLLTLEPGQKYMGYCDATIERKELVKEYEAPGNVTLLIGPEGDFSPAEVQAAVNAGFVPTTFGNTRLRTETAALYALTAIHVVCDMLSPQLTNE